MNWDVLGAAGELIGAVAVVVSVIYLAIQIRASTNLAKAQMFQSAAAEQSRVTDSMTGDPGNLETWLKMHNGDSLTPLEALRAQFLIAKIIHAMLAIQIAYDKRQVSAEYFLDAKAQISELFRGRVRPRAKHYLETLHPNLKHSEIFAEVMASGDRD
ncbi:MAG TPA: hypothetical protein VLA56_01105 [Pseudomonadales bacterium]|nr:hypothetical protein [Pseudomonadales bacterium]